MNAFISIQKSNQLKSIAIVMMLCLHLFNRDYEGLFVPLVFIGAQPLSYYISLFSDACVPIFAFVSGYGLYYKYTTDRLHYHKGNRVRLKKLYLNYWIVLLLFAVLLGWILGAEKHPGSWSAFVLNFTGLDTSYNGAWWFFTTYVLFVLTSTFWFRLLDRVNPYIYFVALLVVYFIAFYFRIYKTDVFLQPVLQWAHKQAALYFCTLFQFMMGVFALRFHWHNKVSDLFRQFRWPTLVALIGIVGLVVFHGVVPNLVIAPFTALGFIFLFLQLQLGVKSNRVLDYFTPHSTNLWLIHMFFYLIYFKAFVYSFTYVPLIFGALLILCLLSSYVVNYINRYFHKMLISN